VSLDFALRFVDGRGVLDLSARTLFDLVGVEKLELEVPNLRFPFDVSGGAQRFQSRRCNFTAAELRVDGARLQAWLERRALLSRLGLSSLRARLSDGSIILQARARVGDREAPLTARVTLSPSGPQQLVVRIGDVRAYGYLPAPAPLVGLGIALGLGAQRGNDAALSVRGTGEIALNPLELLLWNTLPPSGWRLPRYAEATLAEARVGNDAIVLRYATGAASPAPPATVDSELRGADALLARGSSAPLPTPTPSCIASATTSPLPSVSS
jgi:hypothetical protein